MSKPIERVEIITGRERHRRYTAEEKVRLVEQTMQPGMTVSAVAQLHGVSPSLLFPWRRRMAEGGHEAVRADEEVVRVAFAIDTHNREIIAWVATSCGGISGETIRAMMLDYADRRFDAIRAPQPIQWLADNGSAYTAAETIGFAAALNLVPCFTPIRSPESNGACAAFVKTLKRDYARAKPRPDAISVLQQIPAWFEDYKTIHAHSGLRMRSPHEFIAQQSVNQAACPV